MRNTTRTPADPARPARGNFTPPGSDGDPTAGRRSPAAPRPRRRLSTADWRVRTRLNAILLVPVSVALLVGGFNVKNAVDRWQQADDAVRTAQLVRAAEDYGHALLEERDLTAAPLLADRPHSPVVARVRAASDRAARRFRAAAARAPASTDLDRRLAAFDAVEPGLTGLREEAYTDRLPGVRTEEAYVTVEHPLIEFANELGFGTDNLTSYGRTLYAISLTEAAESLTRSIGTQILREGPVPAGVRRDQLTALASYAYLENIALEEFRGGGTPQDVKRLTAAEAAARRSGTAATAAAGRRARAAGRPYTAPPDRLTMVRAIASGASATRLRARGITAGSWQATATLAFDAYRSVETRLAGQAEQDASVVAGRARRDAITDSAVVVLGVLAAFAVAAAMARSMSRAMLALRGAAFEVAGHRLPALVDRLSQAGPGRVDTTVDPIPIDTHEEIGEVARAFDQVHREAVRLAAEQAMLRGNVNAIFTNLSLRNQGLIERQLALITDLENNEADPDKLASLFRLDHLATRMRRNGENLLVLAGGEPGRQWNRPVPLVDVLRAAASEVEQYERIVISGVPVTEIHGAAVTDLAHLLAELLENATLFSSPHTQVRVTATRLPDGRIVVEIHDMGIGLTAEDFADINRKLADPPTVDAAVSRRMGLFVVGRLAGRHAIRVQLRPSGEQAGTTSLVMLPEPITHGGGDAEAEGDFTVSRIVPEHRASALGAGQLTAAELGFDDRRYEIAQSGPELRPVDRSLRLEGRRAALEAATGEREAVGTGRSLFGDESAAQGRFAAGHDQSYPAYDHPSGPPVYHPGGLPGYRPGPGLPPQPEYLPPAERPGPLPPAPERVGYDAPLSEREQGGQDTTAEQRSTNDQLRQRAGRAREPRAGGVTPAGLPQRIPRAGLVPGTAGRVPRTGPLVSRAPEDVRGRLSRLRRGLRQGRDATTDAGAEEFPSPTDSQGSGPNHQER